MHHVYTVHGHLGSVWHARSTSGEELAWAADAVDAKGRLTSEVYGNGLMGLYDYHPQSDRLQEIRIGTAPNGEAVGEAVTQYYGYDNLGRLINKSDTQATLASPNAPPSFNYQYDALDRLTSVNQVSQTYEANGNLKTRGGTTYIYGDAANPHAVTSVQGTIGQSGVPGNAVNPSYSYNANGNMASGGGRTYTWTAFDQPSTITQPGAADTTFLYDDAHSRVKETAGGTVTVTINPRLDLGHGFQRVIAPTQTTDTLYVSAMGRPVATIVTTAGAAGTSRSTRWLHADALGSVVAVTDADGEAVARYAYDAWGLRLGWAAAGSGGNGGERRGYTGHETLEGMGLVNMNGRLYDPALARFVSADPFVQSPDDWQSYNRYSYVLNNPLGYTDPSGYFHLGRFLRTVAAIAATVWAPQLSEFAWGGSLGSALGVTAGNVVVQGATAGFVAGGIQGGTLKSALIGAAGGAAFGGIHGMEGLHIAERAVLHGVVGGAMSAAEGGNFGSGFLSTAFTTYASDAAGLSPKGGANKVTATVVRAIIGGVAARIAGGKFANGAMSAAMASALNDFAAEMSADGSHRSEGDTAYPQTKQQWIEHTLDFADGAATTVGLALAPAAAASTVEMFAAGRFGQFSDYVRWGPTTISKQLVEGPGAIGAVREFAIKGGGTNAKTGFGLPYHFHIHRYNWYRPWTWFKQTPVLKQ